MILMLWKENGTIFLCHSYRQIQFQIFIQQQIMRTVTKHLNPSSSTPRKQTRNAVPFFTVVWIQCFPMLLGRGSQCHLIFQLTYFLHPTRLYACITHCERSPGKAPGHMSSKVIHYLLFLPCGNFGCFFYAEFVNFSYYSRKANSCVFIVDITHGPLNHITEQILKKSGPLQWPEFTFKIRGIMQQNHFLYKSLMPGLYTSSSAEIIFSNFTNDFPSS